MPRPTPKSFAPAAVTPVAGEPLRYWVGSRSRSAVKHMVDLAEFGGNGECSCERFTFTLGPLLKSGSAPSERTECRHIAQAKRHFTTAVIKRTLDAWAKRDKETR